MSKFSTIATFMLLATCAMQLQASAGINYEIGAGVLDGGGRALTGPVYTDITATGQSGQIGRSSSVNYSIGYGFIPQQFDALPPSLAEISINSDNGSTPLTPTTVDNLICTVDVPSTVSPGLTVMYEYSWSNGVDTVVHGPKIDPADTLIPAFTLKNQTWTCSVRAYDGHNFSPLVAQAAITTDNTAPTAPTIDMPALQSSSGNLVCMVDTESFDPDTVGGADVVAYSFEWFLKRPPAETFSEFFGAIDSTFLSLISDTDTQPGDEWYCTVTPSDDEGDGPSVTTSGTPTSIVQGGITPSIISLSLNPTVVTLGQSITASGTIFPQPIGSEIVSFESTSPGTVVDANFPVGTTTPNAIFSKTFFPNEASLGRPDWSVTASWDGDTTFTDATSLSQTFVVHKAQPVLEVSLSVSSEALNYGDLIATATLSASLPGSLSSLLENQTITLFPRKPDFSSAPSVQAVTDANGVAVFDDLNDNDFANAGVVFDEAGTWQFIAEFDGDENFERATSHNFDGPDTPRLTIKDGAGYAILIVGALDDSFGGVGEGQAEHAKTMDFAYRAFRARGFSADDIYYLREGPAQPAADIDVDDTSPSQGDLQTAIETWALGKMNASPGPLYVCAIDHGSLNKFFVYSGNFGEERVVTPTELDGYLDTLQGNLNQVAADEEVVFIYGACHSGSFIPELSGTNRTIVTSSRAEQISHRGAVDPIDGIRDGEVFITELFRGLRKGNTLKESFEVASRRITEFTLSRSNGASLDAEFPQVPLLDDNGDGAGSVADALVFDPTVGQDGAGAFNLVLGFGVNAGDSVGWLNATPSQVIGGTKGTPTIDLFAASTDAPATGHSAWIEVKTPTYAGADFAATGATGGSELLEDFQQVITMFQFD